jgi:putative tricarboxylic transport membrane protein
MELLSHLALGFETALSLQNLAYAFLGCLLGTLIGVLPGLGPSTTIAMLLPITYTLEPVAALIMLAGIYYGAQYGGSTTAILVNLPGEVVLGRHRHRWLPDGAPGPRRRRARHRPASARSSPGCVATLVLAAFAVPMSELAFKFGPAEYFSLMVLGLVGAVVLASGRSSRRSA